MLVLLGVGFGAALPALMGQAMSAATPADAGIASSLVNTTQQVGASIGTAVLVTLASARTNSLLTHHVPAKTALTSGFHLSYTLSAAFITAGLIIAVTVRRHFCGQYDAYFIPRPCGRCGHRGARPTGRAVDAQRAG